MVATILQQIRQPQSNFLASRGMETPAWKLYAVLKDSWLIYPCRGNGEGFSEPQADTFETVHRLFKPVSRPKKE